MSEEIRTLRDLALAASVRHDGKRGRALGREAAKRGLTLSYTTVDNILAGKYTSTPQRRTVDALAELAGVSKRVAYKAAGLPVPQAPFADQLPPEVDTLNSEQRRVLVDLARVFVKQNQYIYELEAGNATQAEDEGRSDPGVQGARDRTPMSDVHHLDQGKLQPPPPAERSAAYEPQDGSVGIRGADESRDRGEENQDDE